MLLATTTASCTPAIQSQGCAQDADCSGDAICLDGACATWPDSGASTVVDGGLAADGGFVAADGGFVTADAGFVAPDADAGFVAVDGGPDAGDGGFVAADGGFVAADGGFVGGDAGAQVDPLPVGAIVAFVGDVVPAGWLRADGAELARGAHPALYAAIGTAFGAGDGSTTFRLPDLRARMPLGQTTAGKGAAVGEVGGALHHVHDAVLAAHDHGVDLAAHDHDVAPPSSHAHSFSFASQILPQSGATTVLRNAGGFVTNPTSQSSLITEASGAVTTTSSIATQSATVAGADPPIFVVDYIVRALPTAAPVPCGGLVGSGRFVDAAPAAEGQVVARSTAAQLFSCIGERFGAGDGTTTFALPDLRGRFGLGAAAAGPEAAVGFTAGTANHTHDVAIAASSHTVDLPDHFHALDVPGHTHSLSSFSTTDITTGASTFGVVSSLTSPTSSAGGGTLNGTTSGAATVATTANGVQAAVTSDGEAPFLVLRLDVTDGTAAAQPGIVVAFGGAAAPLGWLVADGSLVQRQVHGALFAAIGERFGAGDGLTTFALPDLRGRFVRGRDAAGEDVAATGGALDHTHTFSVDDHVHDVPASLHDHAFMVPSHSHTISASQACCANDQAGPLGVLKDFGALTTSTRAEESISTTSGGSPSAATEAAGAQVVMTDAANPPYAVVTFLIKD